MTRGRKPLMALREAELIAKKRGETRQFMHEPGTICNFVIYCLGFTAFIRIKRVTRVHCSHTWIEREAADALASLRAIAPGTGISRELWVFLPRGAFRFFRIEDTGLVELDRDGVVMPERPTQVFVVRPTMPDQPAPPAQETPAEAITAGAGGIPPFQAPPGESSVGERTSEKGKGC